MKRQAGADQQRDEIDRIVAQWQAQRPDLDPSAKQVSGRIVRLAALLQRHYGEVFAELGLRQGDYGVLAALRRAGKPFELTPTALARSRMMTTGGMTTVLDRLEGLGLLERGPNPDDRRGALVRLTSKGQDLVNRAMERHTAAEHDAVSALTVAERDQLTGLLRKLLLSLDS